ncbi:MAG: DUF485 domain-containing protein [Prolixibacteraceae bacterium]|jgi:uncharacterized membrane protein (DUF485 family)|nr:DUF485 domain-containing protein [Prolixibacteraceae bacterium]
MHGSAAKLDTDLSASRKSKLGIKLFIVYIIVYAGFVVISLINPDLMGHKFIGEQNLAIVYGFGLIILAIVMGFIYNAMCTRLENKLNKTEKGQTL